MKGKEAIDNGKFEEGGCRIVGCVGSHPWSSRPVAGQFPSGVGSPPSIGGFQG